MEQAKAKILVVDDTKTNIEVLENVLMDHYDVFVAKNGKKAIEIAEKVLPDLILLDVMMPEMNGYETMRAMKGMESLKNIPVFFLTAKSDNESEQIGLDLGAVDYIGKPFNPQLVLLRVKNQLEYKRQRDHLHELVDEKTADLRRTLKVMLTSLGSLAEFRDPETGAHIKRTQVIVQRLAEVLQKNPKYARAIPSSEYVDYYATAAPLHDIGKVGIEDEILRKPAKLNEQRELMRNRLIKAIVCFLVGVLMLLIHFISGEILWNDLHKLYRGIFGIFGFSVPFILNRNAILEDLTKMESSRSCMAFLSASA